MISIKKESSANSKTMGLFNKTEETLLSWLLNYGVCIQDLDNPAYGGVYAGYDISSGLRLFIYCEITGYATSMFCMLYRFTGEKQYLDAAVASASFLLRHQAPLDGSPAAGSFPEGLKIPNLAPMTRYFSFDTAMCIQGLVDLHRITGEGELLKASRNAGDWLLSMQLPSGSFLSFYDSETGSREHPGLFFHEDAGCLHAKHSIALLKLYAATGDERYKVATRKVCDWALSLQDEDGAFWANPTRSHVYSHAHCYATEGLLYTFDQLKTVAYGNAVNQSCHWLNRTIDKRYGILGTHKIAREFQPMEARTSRRLLQLFRRIVPRREIATDATAQAARLFLFRYLRGDDVQGLYKAEQIINVLLSHAMCEGSSPYERGGLHSRLDISLGLVRPSPIIATWGVLFALQACILLAESGKDKSPAPDSSGLLESLF